MPCTPLSGDELRSRAVAIVDARYGHTMEFSASPQAHADEYDEVEAELTAASLTAAGRRHLSELNRHRRYWHVSGQGERHCAQRLQETGLLRGDGTQAYEVTPFGLQVAAMIRAQKDCLQPIEAQ